MYILVYITNYQHSTAAARYDTGSVRAAERRGVRDVGRGTRSVREEGER